MTYHFYLFVGKFPKLFNFSDRKEKSYLVELNIFKENAFYGLQKILPDNFPGNLYIWSAIMNGTCMQKIKIGHWAKFRAKSKCFPQFYAAFNFRWAYFDSFSWRVHLGVDCSHACSEKPFWASLNWKLYCDDHSSLLGGGGGGQGWHSGESAHLPLMCAGFDSRTWRLMWVEFVVGFLLCSERFFLGYSGFPLSSKTNISKFQFDFEMWLFWTSSSELLGAPKHSKKCRKLLVGISWGSVVEGMDNFWTCTFLLQYINIFAYQHIIISNSISLRHLA